MSYGHCEAKIGTTRVNGKEKDVHIEIGENSGMVILNIAVENDAKHQVVLDYATFGALAEDFENIHSYLSVILQNTTDKPRTDPNFAY